MVELWVALWVVSMADSSVFSMAELRAVVKVDEMAEHSGIGTAAH